VTITTYLRHPQEDVASRARTQLYYMSKPLVQKIIGLTTGDPEMDIEAFVAPLEDATELIPCPQEFDFDDGDWKHRADTHYVEPMIERAALGPNPPSADPIVVPEDKQLIFATAGSMVQDYEFRARDFFRALVGMMGTQDADTYYLVIAAGDRLSGELNREFTNKLKNTLITPWVSQLDVLPDAVAVFMHGGLATIKESIWEEVPIVIVPHGKDQIDNALRIRRSGVGMVSEVDQITPQALRRFLTEATTSSWVKLSLAKMRGIFEAAENSKPSVGIINGVLAS
jgi:UDP:flavonoid glycosyltransferase YjiC (YdhE family)